MPLNLTTTTDIVKVLIRSGTNAERILTNITQGELAYITDTKQVVVGDGFTIGGFNVGNRLYGIGGNSIPLNTLPLSSNNSGFAYVGDTYFCNSNNSYYTLTGANMFELSNYKQLTNITTGDEITVTRNVSTGQLSLLALSANSLHPNIGQGGVTINGNQLTLGPIISTNSITYLLSSLNPFYTEMKVQSTDTNYYRITTQTLKFAPHSYSTLELPKYVKFGNSNVNIIQSNWSISVNGYLYKNNTNVIECSAAPTNRLQYFKQPIDVLKQLPTLSANGTGSIDVTTLSSSNILNCTLSGLENTYTTILFSGTVTTYTPGDYILISQYINGNYIEIPLFSDFSGTSTQSFYFFVSLDAPTTFKYSIGVLQPPFFDKVGSPSVTLSAIAAM